MGDAMIGISIRFLLYVIPVLLSVWLESIPAQGIAATVTEGKRTLTIYVIFISSFPLGLVFDFIASVNRLLSRTITTWRVSILALAAIAKTCLLIYGVVWLHAILFASVGLCRSAPCQLDLSAMEDNKLKEVWIVVHDFWDAVYFSMVTLATVGYGDFVPPPAARLYAAALGLVGIFVFAFQVGVATAIISSLLNHHSMPNNNHSRNSV